MTRILPPGRLTGTVRAIPSKSLAHRHLICAALSSHDSVLTLPVTSADIDATIGCLCAMGMKVRRSGPRLIIQPVRTLPKDEILLRCRESGSTLRFLLPVCGALGLRGRFLREGRLPARPLGPLQEALTAHGMTIAEEGASLRFRGTLHGGDYALPGNLSSQFLSGLLFALPLVREDSTLTITTALESAAYLAMTEAALRESEISFSRDADGYRIPGGQRYDCLLGAQVEGDWSNAAFFLAAGAISGPVTVTNLRQDSSQGDRAILSLLARFGAAPEIRDLSVTVSPAPLRGAEIDAREIPDLIPALVPLAAAAEGETVIRNAARLRLKESDRLAALASLLRALGGEVRETEDGLRVTGGKRLTGGTADARGDHRIAMAAAVCSLLSDAPVVLNGAECVEKSYPAFWSDFLSLRQEAET